MRELSFWLDVRSPQRRRIEVSLEIPSTSLRRIDLGWQDFFLATWTPGSYLIREFARQLNSVRAIDALSGKLLTVRKISKNRVRVELPTEEVQLRLEYSVYSHELSVRTSDLTPEHAYWNHACVLLWPTNQLDLPARIFVRAPAGWSLATALPFERTDDGFVMTATDYACAIDAPCLSSKFERLEWLVRGVPHAIVLDGLATVRPPNDLLDKLTRLIECAADVFGGSLPYPNFQFLCLFSDSGHGGLEHADSTTLHSGRAALHNDKEYRDFLSLAVHELFHCWNVKRMRPVEFWTYDYEHENYTSMLWLAEGFTAYYDDLLCRRANVHSMSDYLGILQRTITTWMTGAGRRNLSLSDSSFDAWIRLYRPDENTRNSSQNYYGNGSLVALVLDLTIRGATGGARCLDHVMRELYRTTFVAGRGYDRNDLVKCLGVAAGKDLGPLLALLVDGPLEPDLTPLLDEFGVKLVKRDCDKPYLGVSFDNSQLTITFVNENGPGFDAMLAPGDEVLALDGLRVTANNFGNVAEAVLAIGKSVRVLTSSRGVIVERSLTPQPNPAGAISLELDLAAIPNRVSLRDGWLGKSLTT
ncbi:peptidase M61 [Planctomycetota bacterium]|nr:peptidase M61 [Planctomycetota bacterium]